MIPLISELLKTLEDGKWYNINFNVKRTGDKQSIGDFQVRLIEGTARITYPNPYLDKEAQEAKEDLTGG